MSKDLLSAYDIAGFDFDENGVMVLKLVPKGHEPQENEPTTRLDFGFTKDGKLERRTA